MSCSLVFIWPYMAAGEGSGLLDELPAPAATRDIPTKLDHPGIVVLREGEEVELSSSGGVSVSSQALYGVGSRAAVARDFPATGSGDASLS